MTRTDRIRSGRSPSIPGPTAASGPRFPSRESRVASDGGGTGRQLHRRHRDSLHPRPRRFRGIHLFDLRASAELSGELAERGPLLRQARRHVRLDDHRGASATGPSPPTSTRATSISTPPSSTTTPFTAGRAPRRTSASGSSTRASSILSGGPTKVEFLCHRDTTQVRAACVLNYWRSSHYGGAVVAVGEGEHWTKVIGPFFLYVNSGGDPQALCKTRSARRQGGQRWPYDWVAGVDYPRRSDRATSTASSS